MHLATALLELSNHPTCVMANQLKHGAFDNTAVFPGILLTTLLYDGESIKMKLNIQLSLTLLTFRQYSFTFYVFVFVLERRR